MEQEIFRIEVRNEKYIVQPVDLGSETQFKIETDCNYLMTIYRDEDGSWSANKDVEVLDSSLVSDIGSAIEAHDA